MVNITTLERDPQTDTQSTNKPNPKPKARARYVWTRTLGKPDTAHDTKPQHTQTAHVLSRANENRLRTIEQALTQIAQELKQAGHTQAAHMVRGRAFSIYEVRMASLYAAFNMPFVPTEDAKGVDVSSYVTIK